MLIIALALAAAVQTAPAAASPVVRPPAIHRYAALRLSPTGDRMVSLEAGQTVAGQMGRTVVVIRDLSGKVITQADPCGACNIGDIAWAPDGQSLAIAASDDKGVTTLYNLPVTGGTATVLTSYTGLGDDLEWSPDGKTLAFLAVVNPHKKVGATQAGARQVGEIGVASVIDEQRIATVSHPGDQPTFVSPADTWVYEFDWTRDGKGFVATAAKGDGDNNWWTAKLEAFAPGSERVIAAPKMQMNYPRISADGKSVYFIGGLMSDFGSVGGDIYAAPLEGGEPVNLTPDVKFTFRSISVTSTGIIAGVISNGENAVARLEPGKAPVIVARDVSSVSVDAAGGTAAGINESFTAAPRIVAGPLQAPAPHLAGATLQTMQAITHDNDAITSPYKATNVSWSNEGFNVEGWLLSPASVAPGKTYPMVTIVHGGPSAAVTPRFVSGGTVVDLLNAGYFVFQPNPRGSYGQGEAFVLSNRRDFGGGDLRDILAGIDAVEKVAPVDDKRLGIYGHSYGGLMSMWTVTHSNRFKAAVAGAGISNWSSYYGENGIDQWMIPFFDASFYDDPAIYDKLSPIRYIKDAKTPTFIYVGERDVECPAAQSQEFWHGLKEMGVPVSLVIYEGEGHGIRSPEHNRDLTGRILGWFGQYLK